MTTVSMNAVRVGALALAAAIAGCSGASNSLAPSGQSVVPMAGPAAHDASAVIKPADGSCLNPFTSDEHFNSKVDIAAGSWLLFTSVFRVPNGQSPLKFQVNNSYITFTAGSQSYTIQAPGARISLHEQDTTHLNWAKGNKHGIWWLMASYNTMEKNYTDFMDQVAWQVPAPGLSGSDFQGSNSVTWHMSLYSAKYPNTHIQWQWGAAVYSQLDNFPPNYNMLGSKPVDDPTYSVGNSTDPAGTPENDKNYLVAGGTNGNTLDYIGGAETNHVENVYPCSKKV